MIIVQDALTVKLEYFDHLDRGHDDDQLQRWYHVKAVDNVATTVNLS